MAAKSRQTLVLLLSLIFAVSITAGVPARTAQAQELTAIENSAAPNFPASIDFRLVADLPAAPAHVEIRYRPAYSPVTQVIRPDFTPANHIEISHSLDMSINYIPPGVDILYRWWIELADGTTLETAEQAIFYMDGRHDWRQFTDGQVTLYFYSGNDSFGQDALETTVRSIDRFRTTFDIAEEEPVRVVVYGNNRDFAAALPPNSSEWIGGFADPELHLIVTGIQPGAGSAQEIRRILSHEVIHLIMAQATDNPFNSPPTWLDEGLATYYQEVEDARFGGILNTAINDGRLIPVRALNSSFPDDPELALLSYAESESIVQFIIEEKGEAQMSALIKIFREGVSYDNAVQQTLGIGIDELDQQWKDWLGYGGDAAAPVAIPGAERSTPDDQVPFLLTTVPLALAALFCIVLGTILLVRARSSKQEAL